MGGVLAAANQKISDRDDDIQQLESKIQNLTSELADRDAAVAADREDLAQFKKEAKEAAAEVHREGMAIKGLEIQWQQRLSDATGELADAKATMLKQADKIRELERGFSLKPNPKESAVMSAQRLEIGELRSQLAEVAADRADVDPIELTNKLNALLGKGRPPKMQLLVKDVRKTLSDLKPE